MKAIVYRRKCYKAITCSVRAAYGILFVGTRRSRRPERRSAVRASPHSRHMFHFHYTSCRYGEKLFGFADCLWRSHPSGHYDECRCICNNNENVHPNLIVCPVVGHYSRVENDRDHLLAPGRTLKTPPQHQFPGMSHTVDSCCTSTISQNASLLLRISMFQQSEAVCRIISGYSQLLPRFVPQSPTVSRSYSKS